MLEDISARYIWRQGSPDWKKAKILRQFNQIKNQGVQKVKYE